MIWAVGVGPGDPELLTVKARHLVERAEVVAGFASVLQVVAHLVHGTVHTLTYANQAAALAEVAAAHGAGRCCVVCFMGDPNVSGRQLLDRVEAACGSRVEIVPGISAVQIVAARASVPLDEAVLVSFHRRGDLAPAREHLLTALRAGCPTIVIPRPWDFLPRAIAAFLVAEGVARDTPTRVWERLTGDETAWRGTLGELREHDEEFGDMSIVLIGERLATRDTPGAPPVGEEAFRS